LGQDKGLDSRKWLRHPPELSAAPDYCTPSLGGNSPWKNHRINQKHASAVSGCDRCKWRRNKVL